MRRRVSDVPFFIFVRFGAHSRKTLSGVLASSTSAEAPARQATDHANKADARARRPECVLTEGSEDNEGF